MIFIQLYGHDHFPRTNAGGVCPVQRAVSSSYIRLRAESLTRRSTYVPETRSPGSHLDFQIRRLLELSINSYSICLCRNVLLNSHFMPYVLNDLLLLFFPCQHSLSDHFIRIGVPLFNSSLEALSNALMLSRLTILFGDAQGISSVLNEFHGQCYSNEIQCL